MLPTVPPAPPRSARRTWNPFLRWPRAALAASALLGLPLLAPLARWTVSTEVGALLQGDQRSLAAYAQAREILGEHEAVLVSLEHPDLFSPAGLALVAQVSEALEGLPGVIEIKSLTHAVQPVRRGFGFAMVPLLPDPPWDAARLAAFRDFCLSHPLVRNVMVAADGRHTVLTATFAGRPATVAEQAAFNARLEAALAPFRAAGVPLRVLALPGIEAEIRATLGRDLRRFVPAALAVVGATLWATFRSLRLAGFALANQALALALLPGLFHLVGRPLTVFTLPLLPFLAGLHLTLLLHLLLAWQRARARVPDPALALRDTLDVVQKPAAFAVLTTLVGLLSLTTGELPQMREFGALGALGLAGVWAFTFGPGLAWLQVMGGRRRPRVEAGETPVGAEANHVPAEAGAWSAAEPGVARAARWVDGLVRGRGWIWAGAAVAAVVTGLGLARLRTDVRVSEMLPPASPTRQALEELDAVYGGINVVPIEFDTGAAGGVNRLEFLRYLEAVHRFAAAQPEVTGVYSYAQLLALANQVWEGGRPEALRLPDSALQIGLFVAALRAYDFPFLAALSDREFRTAQLVVRTRHLPASRYLRLVRAIVAEAERTRPPGVTVSATRGLHTWLEADRRLLRSQARSAALAAGVIGLTLAGLWRSARLAGWALAANGAAVALALAGAGWAGVPLNSVTVMVGALALGVAVDDTVHLLTHWQRARRAGLPPRAALVAALAVKGPPIVWTSVVLTGVCGLFGLSAFPPVAQFGFLLAGAFVAALGAVLVLLPTGLLTRAD